MKVRASASAPIANHASACRVRTGTRLGPRQIRYLGKRAWAGAASRRRDQAQQTIALLIGRANTQLVSPLSGRFAPAHHPLRLRVAGVS